MQKWPFLTYCAASNAAREKIIQPGTKKSLYEINKNHDGSLKPKI